MRFRFGEINIVCTDRGRSLAFYRDVLGLEVAGEEGTAIHMRGFGLSFLLLPEAKAVSPPSEYGARATLSFDLVVDDLAEASAYFQRHAVLCEHPGDPGFFVVRDPDGLAIEIVQA